MGYPGTRPRPKRTLLVCMWYVHKFVLLFLCFGFTLVFCYVLFIAHVTGFSTLTCNYLARSFLCFFSVPLLTTLTTYCTRPLMNNCQQKYTFVFTAHRRPLLAFAILDTFTHILGRVFGRLYPRYCPDHWRMSISEKHIFWAGFLVDCTRGIALITDACRFQRKLNT